MMIQTPRQPTVSRKASASKVPSGHTQAPPTNCIKAVTRPRIAFGEYSAA